MGSDRGLKWSYRRSREVLRDEGVRALVARGRNFQRGVRDPRLGEQLGQQAPIGVAGGILTVAYRTPEQCFHYRVEQKLESYASAGVAAVHVDANDLTRARSLLSATGLLVLYRLPMGRELERLIGEARRLNIPVVYELDDAVYRSDLLEQTTSLSTLPRSIRNSILRGAPLFGEALQACDHALASTHPLAEDMQRFLPGQAFVVDNGIDRAMLGIARGIAADPAPKPGGSTTVITYASGSRTHDHDLLEVAGPISHVLRTFPHVRFRIMGPLALPDVLRSFSPRIRHDGALPYGRFLRELASSDVVIGPLARDGFNQFKSPVKYLEAGLLSKAFVGSRIVFGDYVREGETGLLAEGSDEWVSCLTGLIENAEYRERIAQGAARHVRSMSTDNDLAAQASAFAKAFGVGSR